MSGRLSEEQKAAMTTIDMIEHNIGVANECAADIIQSDLRNLAFVIANAADAICSAIELVREGQGQ